MTKYLTILLLICSHHVISQTLVKKTPFAITFDAGKLSLPEAFRLLKNCTPITQFYAEFYVVKDGKKYMRSYLSLMARNKVYLVEGKRWKKIVI